MKHPADRFLPRTTEQEREALRAIETLTIDNPDPYDPAPTVTYRWHSRRATGKPFDVEIRTWRPKPPWKKPSYSEITHGQLLDDLRTSPTTLRYFPLTSIERAMAAE